MMKILTRKILKLQETTRAEEEPPVAHLQDELVEMPPGSPALQPQWETTFSKCLQKCGQQVKG